MHLTERGEGQKSSPLSPYELNVSHGQPGAPEHGADWFGPLTPITPLASPDIACPRADRLAPVSPNSW
jgi:hypothetical protein